MTARCPCDRAGLPRDAHQCGLCDLDDVNETRTVPPPPAPSDEDIAGVLANDEAAATRLLTIHNGTRGDAAVFPRADVRRLCDAHQHAVESAQRGGRLLEAPTVYPPASERCACGRPDVPGVADCRGCADPVARAVAARLAAEDLLEALTPAQRREATQQIHDALRRRIAARLAEHLAKGPS